MKSRDGTYRRRTVLALVGSLTATGGAGCLRLNAGSDTSTATPTNDSTDRQTDSPTTDVDDPSEESTPTEDSPKPRTAGSNTVDRIFVDAQNRMWQRGATVTTTKPTVAWKQDLDIEYYSRINQGPILSGDYLFFANHQDVLVAVSRTDGTVAWRFNDTSVDSYDGFRSSLALIDGTLVAVLRNDRTRKWEVVGINPVKGQQEWNIPLSLDETREEHMTMVKTDGNRVYIGTNTRADDGKSQLLAVDLSTQQMEWQVPLAEGNLHPEDAAIVDDTAYITTDEAPADMANVLAFDLQTHKRKWETTLPIGEGIPVVDDNHVYLPVQTEEGNDHITALSRTDGSTVWQFEQLNAPRTGVTVDNERVYTVADDRLYAISSTSGDPVWSFKIEDGPQLTGSSEGLPVITDNLVLTGSWFGDTARIRAVEKTSGTLAWTYDVPHGTVTSPFVADETLWTIGYSKQDEGSITLYALGSQTN